MDGDHRGIGQPDVGQLGANVVAVLTHWFRYSAGRSDWALLAGCRHASFGCSTRQCRLAVVTHPVEPGPWKTRWPADSDCRSTAAPRRRSRRHYVRRPRVLSTLPSAPPVDAWSVVQAAPAPGDRVHFRCPVAFARETSLPSSCPKADSNVLLPAPCGRKGDVERRQDLSLPGQVSADLLGEDVRCAHYLLQQGFEPCPREVAKSYRSRSRILPARRVEPPRLAQQRVRLRLLGRSQWPRNSLAIHPHIQYDYLTANIIRPLRQSTAITGVAERRGMRTPKPVGQHSPPAVAALRVLACPFGYAELHFARGGVDALFLSIMQPANSVLGICFARRRHDHPVGNPPRLVAAHRAPPRGGAFRRRFGGSFHRESWKHCRPPL